MAMPLAEWLEGPDVHKFETISQEEASHSFFFRDPARTMWANRDLFASPADGIITTQGRFDPEGDLVEVKGVEVTINSLLGPHAIDSPALVVCVFMTAADVHWNRAPTAAVLTRYPLPAMRTMNVPMLWTERDLLDKGLIRKGTFGFMAANARTVNKCFCGPLRYTYYVVQIADSDVNCIVPLKTGRTAPFNQNERFGQIIWGSMCCLILPLDARYRFKPACKVTDHVEACNDPLVQITLTNRGE
jgi:phosphatidylserine decarboxylase